MPVITRKMSDLKEEILAKIEEKFQDFKSSLIAEIREQIKKEISETLDKEIEKRKELESTVSMLQEHVKLYQEQMNELKDKHDDLEQYGRRLCVRIDGVPSNENETSNDVFENVKGLIEESKSEIPEVAIDRAHRIGKEYTDSTSGKKSKSIIVRFTTFRHRNMFYHGRKNLKHNVKVKMDLTKKRYSISSDALKLSKNFENVNFVMVDINCRLKVVFKNGSSKFFSDCDNLREILNKDR